MKGYTTIFLVLFLIVFSNKIYAQDTLYLDMKTAIKLAIDHNSEINIADYNIETAVYARKEAIGNFLPKLFLSGNYARNINRPVIFLPDAYGIGGNATKLGSNNDFRGAINMSIPIYTHQSHVNKKIADTRLEFQREAGRQTRLQIINATQKAYINYLVAQEVVKVQEAQLQHSQEILEDIQKRRKQGLLTDHDLMSAKVQVAQTKNKLLEAQNNILPLSNMMKLLLDLEPHFQLQLTEKLEIIAEEEILAIHNPTMLEDNSVLKQLDIEIELNKKQIRMEKSAYYPSLEAIGNYNYQAQEDKFDFANYQWVNTSLVGLQLQFNIFNGNKTKNRVKQAQIGQSIAEEQKEYTTRQYQMELEELISNLKFEKMKIEVQRESMSLTEEALALARKRYTYGVGTFLEVNDAVLSYTQARLLWLQAISDLKKAYYDYQLLVGEDSVY